MIADLYPGLVLSAPTQLLRLEDTSTRIRQFHLYWLSKCQGDRLPRREDIDPADIKSLLPSLIVVRLEAEPFRVFYRLYGTQVAAIDDDLTGRYLDELPEGDPPWKETAMVAYSWVGEHRRPIFGRSHQVTSAYGNTRQYFFGVWPLSQTGEVVDQCMAMEDFINLK